VTKTSGSCELRLSEWSEEEMAGVFLPSDTHDLRKALSTAGILEIQELRHGVRLRSTSFVGTITVGNLRITITPKIKGMPLLTLLRYAYGFRNLKLFTPSPYSLGDPSLQELLIHQLVSEAEEIIARGVYRRYVDSHEELQSPRGRIDFGEMASRGTPNRASLPCIHHPRRENCLTNQVLLSGLLLAVRKTDDNSLKVRLRNLACYLQHHADPVILDRDVVRRVQRESNRLTRHYQPSLAIIEILLQSEGVSLDPGGFARAPGFLFDMNRFFQALLARLFRDALPGYLVRNEYRLHGMVYYVPGYMPPSRRSPEPRPDFAILQGTKVLTLLDAKYRDLWQTHLPNDMLYQLAVYALSQGVGSSSVIVYPCMVPGARESRIMIRDPMRGNDLAQVILRPVNLLELEEAVSEQGSKGERKRQSMAKALAFGA